MVDLRISELDDEESLRAWRRIHNTVVPTAPLSLDDVHERRERNLLELARLDGVAVGNSTVRPPSEDTTAHTVIARVLPAHRRAGLGSAIYTHCLAQLPPEARAVVETVVLASNLDGLRFAERHGFVEVERYLLPGDTIPFVTLRTGG